MLAKIKKYMFVGFALAIVVGGIYLYYKKIQYENEIADLYNKIARQSKTIEVQKDVYEKKTLELRNLNDLLDSLKKDNNVDKKTIERLQEEIKKKDLELLAVNRTAIKWKKAYEAEVKANQTNEPGENTDDPKDDRIRVEFEKDFGYVGVKGYTLTNPPIAWLRVQQNRPLFLTMGLTQRPDGGWDTLVSSSEENVQVDVKVSAVNPFILVKKWYEKISVDTGLQVQWNSMSPYVGLSYPVGPVSVSGGLWGDTENRDVGWYGTINYSWHPFERKR